MGPRWLRRVAGMLVVMLVGAGVVVAGALRPVDPAGSPRVIFILRGASSADIGRRLEDAGLIRRSLDFVFAVRVRGLSHSLREGEYRLSPAMRLLEIVDTIARGDVVLHTITIPEGFTADEIVELLAQSGLGDRQRLRDRVRRGAHTFDADFLRDLPVASLEGYLFPDTYRIPRSLSEREVLSLFLDRFAQAVLPVWRVHGAGHPLHEIVTIASLVEREAKVPTERGLIAGVLYNRLRRDWRLEVDATVLYALGRHKSVVTNEDLKVDSPYNTYLHPGLPPGPIANPGLAAILAALVPVSTDYLFYVARPDGSHAFSKTLQEHLAAIRRYRPP